VDQTLKLTLTAITMQFLFLLILRIAARLLPATYHLLRPMTLFSFMTLGLLVLSEGILGEFQLGSISIAGIQMSLALFILFVADTAFLTYLLIDTGGSRESPFTSLLLMLPVLAILLNQPVYPQVSSYVGFVVVALSVGMMTARQEEELSPEDSKLWWARCRRPTSTVLDLLGGKRCRPDAGDAGCLVPSNPGVVTPSRAFVLSGLRRSAQPVLSQNPIQF
jgi:hypothetical protein